jgi:carboxyl-terminal processing protease
MLGTTALTVACVPFRERSPVWVAPSTASSPSFVAQFDSLWTRFNDVYPSFAYKGVDWRAQRMLYRPRAQRARSQDELVAVLVDMLTPLQDLHVWLVDARGHAVPTFRPSRVANFDRTRWASAMRDASYLPHSGDFGEGTVGGYGYLYIGSWKEPVSPEALDLALSRLRDVPGLILDLRTNAGGTDQTALAFASRFTTRAFAASYVEIRTDSRVKDIQMPLARTIGPRGTWQFTRPVVILSGRGGFSATESFVAAMRTLPQVTVIGDTTGGASGNPATFALGNGWRFTVPRWLEFGPDKRPIEGRGVPPHLAMAWDPTNYDSTRDPLIDAAVGLLGERNGVYRVAPAPLAAPLSMGVPLPLPTGSGSRR